MLSIRRVGVASVVVAGIVWTVSCFGTPQPDQTASQGNGPAAASVQGPSETGTLLAARYHLRNRTKRFFQRSTNRVRSARTRRGLLGWIDSASDQEQYLLAARYHLRGRTSRFFQRSTRGASPTRTYYRSYRVPVVPTPAKPTPATPKVTA